MELRKPLLDRIIALHHLTLEMAEQGTESDIQRLAVEYTIQNLDIDRFAVFGIEENGRFLRGTWGTDSQGRVVDESGFRAEITQHAMVSQTLRRRDLVAVEDPVPLLWCDEVVGKGWNAMVAMWQGTHPIGFVSADNLLLQRPFTDEDQEVLKLVAASIGQMLRRVRAENDLRQLNRELEARVDARTEALSIVNQQLHVQARTDSLTGLFNRRGFDEILSREWQRARRLGSDISLLLLDVDYFKNYNDTLGHEAGDRCLQELSVAIQAACRRVTDLAARIGGEEFALLLPDTGPEGACHAGKKVLDVLAEMNLEHPDSPVNSCITVSIGVAASRPHSSRPDLLRKADYALYRVKHSGRNGISLFAESGQQ